MIFDSIEDKSIMNAICGVVGFISIEAGRRYNVLQAEEREKRLQEIEKSLESLEVRIVKSTWLKKRKDLVAVHLGESKRKRGRPVRAKLVKIA
jgi:hypothetical protein